MIGMEHDWNRAPAGTVLPSYVVLLVLVVAQRVRECVGSSPRNGIIGFLPQLNVCQAGPSR